VSENIYGICMVFLARCRVRFSLAYHSGYAAFNLPGVMDDDVPTRQGIEPDRAQWAGKEG
jgi:hypothetical protein